MRGCGRILGGAVCSLLAPAASADAVFNIWVEAPAQVRAGETFTASVWAEVSGSILEKSDGGFYDFVMDLLAFGVDTEFSAATIPSMNLPLSLGIPEPNALRRVGAGNLPHLFDFAEQNPLLLFYTEVTTAQDSSGSLELTVAPAENLPAMLSWWVDYGDLSIILDTDPGSTRIITPAIVNVIPTPASLGLLALACVGAVRRRR